MPDPDTNEGTPFRELKPGDRYVALGSSFGAGPGIPPRVEGAPRASGRSANNYAHLLAARLELDLDDVTFSGATAAEMLAAGGQIEAVTETTRLVTVTGGGNDVGYIPGLVAASVPRFLRVLPSIRRGLADTNGTGHLDERFDQLTQTLTSLVREVRRRAPHSIIVLVDYVTLVPADESIATPPLSSGAAHWGRTMAARLVEVTRAVAAAEGCLYAAASDISASHHAFSAEPWSKHFHYSLRGGAPYHPNAAGMAAIAALVGDQLNRPSVLPE
ncbi:SGNH/GDSL hydrolase family protein [Subtercola lobariae]|uniref:SGNH hydrolase-type esterase domain-containing protein n=1 Tax=Subtercola lobariae TaxID=1588641 RepID=A0A917B964_9MICO|nr:SGNH/GDSL hydrolase family protein [Subtercola lobariae]GGF31143.1 hypothetical protein GCM10011399_25440 [Subtercola lobariae]